MKRLKLSLTSDKSITVRNRWQASWFVSKHAKNINGFRYNPKNTNRHLATDVIISNPPCMISHFNFYFFHFAPFFIFSSPSSWMNFYEWKEKKKLFLKESSTSDLSCSKSTSTGDFCMSMSSSVWRCWVQLSKANLAREALELHGVCCGET